MSHYSDVIANDLGVSAAMASLAEELLRTNRTGLDGLTRGELLREARDAVGDVLAWHAAGEIGGVTVAEYCAAMSLVVPVEVSA